MLIPISFITFCASCSMVSQSLLPFRSYLVVHPEPSYLKALQREFLLPFPAFALIRVEEGGAARRVACGKSPSL